MTFRGPRYYGVLVQKPTDFLLIIGEEPYHLKVPKFIQINILLLNLWCESLMENTVITSETSSTPFQVSAGTKIICRVCQKQFSQYTCPRCNSRYCSLQCYKAHSLRCTESFMKENVEEELQQMQPDDQAKQKMLDILKRFHSEEKEMDSMDADDDNALSEETMQKIVSGDQISMDDLSAEEMKRFQRAMATRELSELIEPWEPWWYKPSARTISFTREGTTLFQSVENEDTALSQQDSQESDLSTDIPAGPVNPLPSISKLSRTEPSPLLAVHLVDIIYSYCFTLRFYNGDWKSDPLGAATVVLSISSVLSQGGHPETVSETLAHCLEQTCSPAYKNAGGLQFGLALFDDVISLLNLGKHALICLLCDLQQLIQASGHELKKSEIKSKLKLADRKVYFLMCWVNEQPSEAWSSLAAIVGVEKGSVAAILHGTKTKPVQLSGKGQGKNKVLIEEV